jgi:transposase
LDTPEQVEQYRQILKVLNGEIEASGLIDPTKVVFCEHRQYLDVLVMNELWDQLGFNSVFGKSCDNGKNLSTAQVAKILTINRLIQPSSKVKTIEWLNKTMLPYILDIDVTSYNRSKIFRELTSIHATKNSIEQLLWDHSIARGKGYEAYYFDGSTSWFEGNHCSLAEADLEKTRGFFPNVVGLMLITDNQGFPVSWEIVNGHKKDVSELKKFVSRITDKFKIKEITYCFDRGVASESNFDFIDKSDNKYISAIRDNQIKDTMDLAKFQLVRTKISEFISHKNQMLTECAKPPSRRIIGIDGFQSFGENIFFKDLGVIDYKRYVVSFNHDLYLKEQQQREQRINAALLSVAEKNLDLATASRDRDFNATERDLLAILTKNSVKNYFNYAFNPLISSNIAQSFEIKLSFNKERIELEQLTDGILIYITNHIQKNKSNNYEMSAREIVAHYKGKYVVENAFRELKSFLDLRPIHVWTADHVKAHYDICIISYYINNYIYLKLKDRGISLRQFFEHVKQVGVVAKLRTPSGIEIFKRKPLSDDTRKYFELLGLTNLLSPDLHRRHGVSL